MIKFLDKIEMLIYLDFEKNENFKNAGTAFSSSVIDSEILEKVEEIDKMTPKNKLFILTKD